MGILWIRNFSIGQDRIVCLEQSEFGWAQKVLFRRICTEEHLCQVEIRFKSKIWIKSTGCIKKRNHLRN